MTDSPENRNDGSENREDGSRIGDQHANDEARAANVNHDAPVGERSDVPQPPQAPPGQPTPPTPPVNESATSSHYAPPVSGSVPPAFDQQGANYGQHAPNQRATNPNASAPTPEYANARPVGYQGDPNHNGKSTDKTARRGTIGLVAALAVGALVGGVSGAAVTGMVNSGQNNETATSNSSPANITVNDPADATTITAVAASAGPSVVTISVSAGNGSGGTGSGVILTKDGYVLTNSHVVTLDGASGDATVSVQTSDGRLLDATIVGTDPISDLAVIKIDDATDLQPAEFADSSKLNVGDTAVAIGAPLGLANTVTNGIVSSLNRSITVASSAAPEEGGDQAPDDNGNGQQGPFDFWQFGTPDEQQAQPQASSTIALSVIQTDAAINPGNSGGALLDSDGRVIGINVAIASAGSGSSGSQSGSIGVGFAIPANLAKRIAGEIIESGTGTHGLLGASVSNVDGKKADVVGASIQSVSAGGAAEAAGLRAGDIVTKLNDVPVTSQTDLTAQVRALPGGADAEITYVRDGEASTTGVSLGTLGE